MFMKKQRKNLTGTLHEFQPIEILSIGALEDAGLDSGRYVSKLEKDGASILVDGEGKMLELKYIKGDDGNFYRVNESELSNSIYSPFNGFEGLRVCFETPVVYRGKNRWAYNIHKFKSEQ